MAADDINWWQLLQQLLTERDDDIFGERDAVLELGAIHARFEAKRRQQQQPPTT